MITIEDFKRVIQDIKDDKEWINDSHSKFEYIGICQGLDRALRHFEEISKEKNTICIEWGVDDIRSLGYTCTDEEGMEVLDAVKKGSSKKDLTSKKPDAINLPEFKVLSYNKL